MSAIAETAFAKINLALHVRGRLPDGRHRLETIFDFCEDGDTVSANSADALAVTVAGPFAAQLEGHGNLVLTAAKALQDRAGVRSGAALHLDKRLPVASGIGGGSADAAATLRLLTRLWEIDPHHADEVAPAIGADVPACLVSRRVRGDGAGDELSPLNNTCCARRHVLLVNPLVPLRTRDVFGRWDGVDRGPLREWQEGRNDLEAPARELVPAIDAVVRWLRKRSSGDAFVRMSGSGPTCFAFCSDEHSLARLAAAVPAEWWHLATRLR